MNDFFTVPEGKEPTPEDVQKIMDETYVEKHAQFPDMFPDDAAQRRGWEEFMGDTFLNMLRMRAGEPLDTVPYPRPASEIGDLMTVEEWIECCECGGFIDYDGFGQPVRLRYVEWSEGLDPTTYPTMVAEEADVHLKPSTRHLIPKDATHINWYNR